MRYFGAYPAYRLIIDLRDNPGGDTQPFRTLLRGIISDNAIDQTGRIFGLVNQFTASSATLDADSLRALTRAILIGQPTMMSIDTYDNDALLILSYYGIVIGYTTKLINPTGKPFALPAITLVPALHQVLTGADPVLATALG